MTVFPIFLIELLTLALIILAIYRVIKAISTETNRQANTQVPAEMAPSILKSAPENRPENKSQAEFPDTKTQTTKIGPNQVCKQTVLHNYIGDFF